jgi:hypothetical protein
VKEFAMENAFWAELERRDVVFRMKQSGKSKPPFAIGLTEYQSEIDNVLKSLRAKDINVDEAVGQGTGIMEKYYGAKYSLA